MLRRVVSMVLVVQMVLWFGVPGVARAQQSQACVSAVPANVQAGILTREFIALLQASPTFRSQCERIAAAPYARVRIEVVDAQTIARADTAMTRYQAGALYAHVRIRFGQNYPELMAHEFEHIIEQLECVDLRAEVARGRAWAIESDVFETRRASEAGVRVRHESELSETHAIVAVHNLR